MNRLLGIISFFISFNLLASVGVVPILHFPHLTVSEPTVGVPISFNFMGPLAYEDPAAVANHYNLTDDLNVFRDLRLVMVITDFHSGEQVALIHGHFAADGISWLTNKKSGTIWRFYFTPHAEGIYNYQVYFQYAPNLAVLDEDLSQPDLNNPLFTTLGPIHGSAGQFTVTSQANKNLAKGYSDGPVVKNSGDHFPRYVFSGKPYYSFGQGSPETFLAYKCFDNTEDLGGLLSDDLHSFTPHLNDALPTDPLWNTTNPECDNTPSAGIIGSLNYLADKGINSFYFLVNNFGNPESQGDGQNIWPWVNPNADLTVYDISKLDQWNLVFDHMDRLGIHLHLLLQETEIDQAPLFPDIAGASGLARKIFYKEMISRFSHHLNMTFILGEELNVNIFYWKQYSNYIKPAIKQYGHMVGAHTYPIPAWITDAVNAPYYSDMLGEENFDRASLQVTDFKPIQYSGYEHKVFDRIQGMLSDAGENGNSWSVSIDELGPAGEGVLPDDAYDGIPHDKQIRAFIDVMMAGGQGMHSYYGFGDYTCNDLKCDDFTSRALYLEFIKSMKAIYEFLRPIDEYSSIPRSQNKWSSQSIHREMTHPSGEEVIYLWDADRSITGQIATDSYVFWMNPRNGTYTVETMAAGTQNLEKPAKYNGVDAIIRIVAI